MGQILAYNHKHFSIGPAAIGDYSPDWELIDIAADTKEIGPTSTAVNDEVAMFLHEIGLAVHMVYKPDGSSSIWNVLSLLDVFELCRSLEILDVDSTNQCIAKMRQMIYEFGYPVFIRGSSSSSGHAWVLDGWRHERAPFPALKEPSYLHRYFVTCNFGWNGTCDGLYELGFFNLMKDAITVRI